jgi:isopentenyldiphosphate isomerase
MPDTSPGPDAPDRTQPVEYLDIVDDRDRVVGRDTRQNVHANHEIHRGVHVFIVSSDRRILIQRRSPTKSDYPGYLDVSVGAQVSAGESYDGAARRELNEELGCGHDSVTEIAAYDGFSSRQREKRRIFVHHCDGPFRPSPEEVADIGFYTVEQISAMMATERFTEGFRRSFAILLEVCGAPPDLGLTKPIHP